MKFLKLNFGRVLKNPVSAVIILKPPVNIERSKLLHAVNVKFNRNTTIRRTGSQTIYNRITTEKKTRNSNAMLKSVSITLKPHLSRILVHPEGYRKKKTIFVRKVQFYQLVGGEPIWVYCIGGLNYTLLGVT